MTRRETLKQLKSNISFLEKAGHRLGQSPYSKVEGSIQCKSILGSIRFYHYVDGKHVYICTDSPNMGREKDKLVRSLAQKLYVDRLVKAIGHENAGYRRCVDILEGTPDINDVYASLPEPLKKYVAKDPMTDDGFAKAWHDKRFEHKGRPRTNLVSALGEPMRSKSELLIADRLTFFNVVYHYEEIVVLFGDDSGVLHPDFRILNKRTRKEFLWEHMGRMDDPEYCQGALERIEEFARYGYHQGQNLIITQESSMHPLSMSYVDMLIRKYLA